MTQIKWEPYIAAFQPLEKPKDNEALDLVQTLFKKIKIDPQFSDPRLRDEFISLARTAPGYLLLKRIDASLSTNVLEIQCTTTRAFDQHTSILYHHFGDDILVGINPEGEKVLFRSPSRIGLAHELGHLAHFLEDRPSFDERSNTRFGLSNGEEAWTIGIHPGDPCCENAFHLAFGHPFLRTTHRGGSHFSFEAALLQGATGTMKTYLRTQPQLLRTPLENSNLFPVHFAAQYGDGETLETLLPFDPSQVDLPSLEGKHPIHYASAAQSKEALTTLLRYDSKTTRQISTEGMYPIHYAALDGSKEVIEALLQADPASIHLPCAKGLKPLDYATDRMEDAIEQLIRQKAAEIAF